MEPRLGKRKLPLVGGPEVAGVLPLPGQGLRGLGPEVRKLPLVAEAVCLALRLCRLQLPLETPFSLLASLDRLRQSAALLLQSTESGHRRVMLPILHSLEVGQPRPGLGQQVPHPTQILFEVVRPFLGRRSCSPQLSRFSPALLLHPLPLLILPLQVPLQVLQRPHVGLPPPLVGRPDLRPLSPLHLQLVLQVLVVVLQLTSLLLPLTGELRAGLGDALLGRGDLVFAPAGGVLSVRQLPPHLLRPLHRLAVGISQRLHLRPRLPHLGPCRMLQALQLPLHLEEVLLELVALAS
mmetsp:Transcript_50262/g.109938  ORF Transcript_50262/g.109938 Transcript_50262/m.109938 type:complete len:294 (-) Transcript_50262:1016-1897(-)